jgi:coenzyme F420-0:L-glutamate ligase / coenzyme F420-1:gamma-L-glutamate ligase
MTALRFAPVAGLPLVAAGDDLAALIATALRDARLAPTAGDVIAVAQKVVSKAEDRLVELGSVIPSAEAQALAARADKDPRVAELILRESRRIVRVTRGVIIAEHHSGTVLANAGIDRSNVAGRDQALLWPVDPDASARRLRAALERAFGGPLGVLITDSVGRAWRLGTVGHAIGAAGVTALLDLRGRADLFGRQLQVSEVAVADSLAAAAVLAMGEAAEGTPVVLISGAPLASGTAASGAVAVLRAAAEDLFR